MLLDQFHLLALSPSEEVMSQSPQSNFSSPNLSSLVPRCILKREATQYPYFTFTNSICFLITSFSFWHGFKLFQLISHYVVFFKYFLVQVSKFNYENGFLYKKNPYGVGGG